MRAPRTDGRDAADGSEFVDDLLAGDGTQFDHLGADCAGLGEIGKVMAQLAKHVLVARLVEIRTDDGQRIGAGVVAFFAQQPGSPFAQQTAA